MTIEIPITTITTNAIEEDLSPIFHCDRPCIKANPFKDGLRRPWNHNVAVYRESTSVQIHDSGNSCRTLVTFFILGGDWPNGSPGRNIAGPAAMLNRKPVSAVLLWGNIGIGMPTPRAELPEYPNPNAPPKLIGP